MRRCKKCNGMVYGKKLICGKCKKQISEVKHCDRCGKSMNNLRKKYCETCANYFLRHRYQRNIRYCEVCGCELEKNRKKYCKKCSPFKTFKKASI